MAMIRKLILAEVELMFHVKHFQGFTNDLFQFFDPAFDFLLQTFIFVILKHFLIDGFCFPITFQLLVTLSNPQAQFIFLFRRKVLSR